MQKGFGKFSANFLFEHLLSNIHTQYNANVVFGGLEFHNFPKCEEKTRSMFVRHCCHRCFAFLIGKSRSHSIIYKLLCYIRLLCKVTSQLNLLFMNNLCCAVCGTTTFHIHQTERKYKRSEPKNQQQQSLLYKLNVLKN